MFDCVELDCAKHWDGNTEKDVTRLLSLSREKEQELCEDCISRAYLIDHCIYDLDNNMVCDLDDIRNAPSVYPKSDNSVLEDIKAEILDVYNNLTYQENHKVGGTWGLRKSLEIIDKHISGKES